MSANHPSHPTLHPPLPDQNGTISLSATLNLASCHTHSFIPLLALLFTLSSSLAAPATYIDLVRAKKAGKPNIILFVAEDLGYGDLGCYGQPRIRTPHLDQLAGEGIRFQSWYTGSPSPQLGKASILTGHMANPPGSDPKVDANGLSLGALMQEAGYKTCALGVWNTSQPASRQTPLNQGFDEWLGLLDSDRTQSYYPAMVWRNERQQSIPANTNGQKGLYLPDLLDQAAINFIRTYRQFPLFLYVSSPMPRANRALAAISGNGMEIKEPHAYSTEDWPAPERNKAAMISHLDESVGKLMALLDEISLDRETLILFTSASGPHADGGVHPDFFHSSGPFQGQKNSLHEGDLRVPCIIRWKGHVPAGKVLTTPAAHWDILPTLCSLTFTTNLPPHQGISLAPVLQGQTAPHRNLPLYWNTTTPNPQHALRIQNWKLLKPGNNQPFALYNLDSDPGEKYDLASQHPD
ncbi:MAG: hypothetical protein RI897_4605, partial [Verrucomicrobiota bacterium]